MKVCQQNEVAGQSGAAKSCNAFVPYTPRTAGKMGRWRQREAASREAKKYEGVELVKKALQLHSAELLFAVDKLMSELVAAPGPTDDVSGSSRVVTLAPLNAFDRKLVHIMVRPPLLFINYAL